MFSSNGQPFINETSLSSTPAKGAPGRKKVGSRSTTTTSNARKAPKRRRLYSSSSSSDSDSKSNFSSSSSSSSSCSSDSDVDVNVPARRKRGYPPLKKRKIHNSIGTGSNTPDDDDMPVSPNPTADRMIIDLQAATHSDQDLVTTSGGDDDVQDNDSGQIMNPPKDGLMQAPLVTASVIVGCGDSRV